MVAAAEWMDSLARVLRTEYMDKKQSYANLPNCPWCVEGS